MLTSSVVTLEVQWLTKSMPWVRVLAVLMVLHMLVAL